MTDMKPIPFTQYMLPDGRRQQIHIERPTVIADKAQDIVNAGHRFAVEMLRNGMISLTIEGKDEDDKDCDVAIAIVDNVPADIFAAIDRMIVHFVLQKSDA